LQIREHLRGDRGRAGTQPSRDLVVEPGGEAIEERRHVPFRRRVDRGARDRIAQQAELALPRVEREHALEAIREPRTALPLLTQEEFYLKARHGYARGWEPARMVDQVQDFLKLLEWQQSGVITAESPPLSNAGGGGG
jgi:hypothetical protein